MAEGEDSTNYDKVMNTQEILRFFETVRIKDLVTFRSLCNALKATLIKESVQAWRGAAKGRFTVLDLGCGKGGDLRKWACYRLKSYIGVDGGSSCIREANSRHSSLVSQGKSSVQADFHKTDITVESIPVENNSMDIVSSMFFLQFAFSSKVVVTHVLNEICRILKDQGVLCCIFPDGDRVVGLLRDRRKHVAFGHFKLRRFQTSGLDSLETCTDPFGLSYNFALTDVMCTEFIVSSAVLQKMLEERGFEGGFPDGSFYESSQSLVSRKADSETVSTVLQGQKCSQVDWMSLGFFKVLLAKKKKPETTTPPASAPTAPLPRRNKTVPSQNGSLAIPP